MSPRGGETFELVEVPTQRPRSPVDPDHLGMLLREAFGFQAFLPHQEEVCRAATLGENVLVVMPTGAGKSLCYQLPGIARAGTTLVISPLIALMEDQVQKLGASGFAVERIHSGRGRAEARLVCQRYLDGVLDFLFIAPERLSVPGFVEFLARRLTLRGRKVAIVSRGYRRSTSGLKPAKKSRWAARYDSGSPMSRQYPGITCPCSATPASSRAPVSAIRLASA